MRRLALSVALLSGCAGYTAQHALTCVRSTLPLAVPAVRTVKDCKDAHNEGGDAVLQCIADSVETALATLNTVEQCLPAAPEAAPAK